MIKDSENILINENEIIIKPKNKNYPKFILTKEDTHYYFIDNNNKEWQFLEINEGKKIIILNAPLKFVKVLE